MTIYYTIHFLIFIACLFELSNDKKTKRNVLFILMIMITLFGGLRWQTGGDWLQYYEHFKASKWTNIFNYQRRVSMDSNLEPLFVLINVILKTCFKTFWMYNLCVVAFVQYTYYKLSWKFSPKYPIIFYAYLMVIASNYFPVRAGLSIAVAYWAYIFLYKRNFVVFSLIILTAYFIHRQCIVLFPLYFVGYLKKWISIPVIIGIFALFAFYGFFFQDLTTSLSLAIGGDLGEVAYHYTQSQNEGHATRVNSYIGWGLNFFFIIVYLYVMRKTKKEDDEWFKTMLLGVLFYNGITMIFREGMGELARLALLFSLAQAIMFVNAFTYFVTKEKDYAKYFAILFFVSYYIYRISRVGTGYYFEMSCIPYKTIFDYNLF